MKNSIKTVVFIIIALIPSYASGNSGAENYKQNGNAWYAMGNYQEAIKEYSKAILIAPDYSAAYFNRGLAYYHCGLYFKAIVDFDKVLSLSPDDAATYFSRGLAYEKTGQNHLAMSDMNKAAQFGDQDALQLIKTGRLQKKLSATQKKSGTLDFDVQTTITTYKKGDLQYDGPEGIYQQKDIFNKKGDKIKTIVLHTADFNNFHNRNKTVLFFDSKGLPERKEYYLTGKNLGMKEILTFNPEGKVKDKLVVNIYEND